MCLRIGLIHRTVSDNVYLSLGSISKSSTTYLVIMLEVDLPTYLSKNT